MGEPGHPAADNSGHLEPTLRGLRCKGWKPILLLACSIVTLERAMLSTACRAAAPAAAAALCVQYAPHGCRAPAEPERHDQSRVKIADAPAAARSLLRGLSDAFARRPAECCGIVGVVGIGDARSFLVEGLKVLQNRGYDSAGLATIAPEEVSDSGARRAPRAARALCV